MASSTRWIWVWANSRRWWRSGKPGMLWSVGSQNQTQHSDWTTATISWVQVHGGWSFQSKLDIRRKPDLGHKVGGLQHLDHSHASMATAKVLQIEKRQRSNSWACLLSGPAAAGLRGSALPTSSLPPSCGGARHQQIRCQHHLNAFNWSPRTIAVAGPMMMWVEWVIIHHRNFGILSSPWENNETTAEVTFPQLDKPQ